MCYVAGSNTMTNKSSDLDIIFGDSQPHLGNGKFTRSGGSLSDAELIFGSTASSAYKTDRFGTSKSMSVTSDRSSYGQTNYKIYEGIQNAAFTDYNDTKRTSDSTTTATTTTTIPSYNSWRSSSTHLEEEEDLDLK